MEGIMGILDGLLGQLGDNPEVANLAAKVGHSEINRQRAKAQAALGPRYDIKAFDDAVVLGGNVPMDVLAKNVEDYIRMARA
jgi:uncharacterized protein (DUF885 family)